MAPVCKLMGLPIPSGFLNPSSLNPQAFFLTDTALPGRHPLHNYSRAERARPQRFQPVDTRHNWEVGRILEPDGDELLCATSLLVPFSYTTGGK